jgi:Zn-dependent M28 family amino/carboxypeptidase
MRGGDCALRMLLCTLLFLPACRLRMPGASFDGQQPPLTPRQVELRDRLRTHVTELASNIGERNWPSYANLERARSYISKAAEEAGYHVRELAFEHRGETFHNVELTLGEIPAGTASIVIGAHYDSVQGSPGANDNASGVAAVLELARMLRDRRLPLPIRFVAFANEEPPYFNSGEGMGSIEYVRGFENPARDVRFMISVETIGYYSEEPGSQRYPVGIGAFYPEKGNFVAFIANLSSGDLLSELLERFRLVATLPSEGAALPESIPGVAFSDQRSFWDAGVPALMITDTAVFRDPHYHRGSDTAERLDYENMARLVDALATAIGEMKPM